MTYIPAEGEFELTIFREDGTELWSCSTNPTHPRPFLIAPDERVESEVDLQKGTAKIGQINLAVLDKRTVASDQGTGAFTAILATAGGESAVNGRRIRLRFYTGDAWRVETDGVCGGVALSTSKVSYKVTMRDENERARTMRAFTLATTSTVLPRGVWGGYGKLPNGQWLQPPVTPLRGRFKRTTDSIGHVELDAGSGDRNLHLVGLTEAVRDATAPEWSASGKAQIFRRVSILWRPESGGAWREIINMELPKYATLFETDSTKGLFGTGTREVPVIRNVVMAPTGYSPIPQVPTIPADNQRVEIVIRYRGEPSAKYPYHLDGKTFGETLADLYDGVHSPIGTIPVRYDPAAVLALKTPLRARITGPVDDVRDWVEKNIYQPLGAAPALDNDGRVSPIRYALPSPDVPLVALDGDVTTPDATWEHPAGDVINTVRVTYAREYRIESKDDPTGAKSDGDGIGSQSITIEHNDAASVRLHGEKLLEMKPATLTAITGTEGKPSSGDVADELGAQIAAERARQAIDRFIQGGQEFTLRSRLASPPRVGDWFLVRQPHFPDYQTNRRGSDRLAQVASAKPARGHWHDMQLVDAGAAAQPVGQPTLGVPTANADGVVSLPISAVPVGGSVRADFAVSLTQPSADSGAWTFMGRTASVGALASPPVPAGATVWLRARGEAAGRRASAWVSVAAFDVAATPRVLSATVDVGDAGTPTVALERNVAAAAVRLYYAVHAPDVTPTLTTFLDTAALTVAPPVVVTPGQQISVEVEPWTGWNGANATGTAGVRVSAVYARSAATALAVTMCRARVVDSSPSTVTVEVDATPAGATVYLYGLTGADRISGAALGVPVVSGSQWTFSRGVPLGAMGQAVFRAESPGYQPDDDAVEIAEQGRDTVGLSMIAQVYSTTATTATVRVRVMDGQPQGPGSIAISHTSVGGGSVAPSTQGLTVSPAASLVDDRAGYFRDYSITRPAFGTGTGRVTFQAYAEGRVPDTDSVDVPAQEKDTVYAGCNAVVTDSSPTQITVQVTSTPAGATVELLGTTGTATLASGPGVGAPVASGQVWVFNRGAALGGLGQAQFRAKLAGYQSDDDTVDIAPQGRDTVGLSTIAQVYSTSATSVTVRVRVVDPQPQGADSIAIGYALVGAATIAPAAQGLTVSPAAALNDDRSGYFRDFIITRPAFKAGTARVSFIATAPNRTPSTDPVDIPAQEQDTVYARCDVSLVSSSPTQQIFQVDVVPTTGTVQLVAIEGSATKAAGPAIGAVVASGQQWTFNRGAPLGSDGRVQFRGSAPGYQPDPGYGSVPEQGRDTVMLAVRAEVMASGTNASQVTVRVRVVDPYPTGGASVMVSYSAAGTGTVTPASGATLTPTASFSTTGYVDLVIQRAAAGSGGGRVTITVTANDRVPGVDAVDVAPLETPQRARPPVHTTVKVNQSASTLYWNIDGVPGAGGTPSVEARIVSDEGEELYEWTAVPFLYGQTMQPRDPITEFVELRDAAGNTSTLLPITAPASLPGIGPTGRTRRDVPMEGTAKTLGDVEGDAFAGRVADTDLTAFGTAGYFDRAGRRVLKVRDGTTGQDVTGSDLAGWGRLSRDAIDATTKQVKTGLAGTATIDGVAASVVRSDARYGKAYVGVRAESRLVNGHAEMGTIAGWTYVTGGPLVVDTSVSHLGGASFRIDHTGGAGTTIWYQDVPVSAGDIVSVVGRLASTALTGAAGAGFAVNVDGAGGAVLQALGGGRRGPWLPNLGDPVDVGIPADGAARSFAEGEVETRVQVLVSGMLRVHLHFGLGGDVAGQVWADGLEVLVEPPHLYERVGLGGNHVAGGGDLNIRTYDPNFNLANGVIIKWSGCVFNPLSSAFTVPGGSVTVAGSISTTQLRRYGLWYDADTGGSGVVLIRDYDGTVQYANIAATLGFNRIIVAEIDAAVDINGFSGGGSDPGSGRGGGNTFTKV